jgi:hypothetical protein
MTAYDSETQAGMDVYIANPLPPVYTFDLLFDLSGYDGRRLTLYDPVIVSSSQYDFDIIFKNTPNESTITHKFNIVMNSTQPLEFANVGVGFADGNQFHVYYDTTGSTPYDSVSHYSMSITADFTVIPEPISLINI